MGGMSGRKETTDTAGAKARADKVFDFSQGIGWEVVSDSFVGPIEDLLVASDRYISLRDKLHGVHLSEEGMALNEAVKNYRKVVDNG